MQIGIVGLPNVGKTTLFNALTRAHAEIGKYPFTTKDSNIGMAEVPDDRLNEIARIAECKRKISATVKFLDIAGLVEGASHGEGLGNQFLSYIREVDVIAHVVCCFEAEDVSHVRGVVKPAEDIDIVNTELILADLQTISRHKEKVAKHLKAGEKEYAKEMDILEKIEEGLNRGKPIRRLGLEAEKLRVLSEVHLLTDKPVIYIANISEDMIDRKENPLLKQVEEKAKEEEATVVPICANLESELSELSEEEKKAFVVEMGVSDSGLNRLVSTCYSLLGMITFFTTESEECRAWSIEEGARASSAAGKVHSDMERGFIKAEVVGCDMLAAAGSFHRAREKGYMLTEGREYRVKDGDVMCFKFSI